MNKLTRHDLEVTIGRLLSDLDMEESHTIVLEGHNPGGEKLYEMQILRKEKDERTGITHYYLEEILAPRGAANIKQFYAYLRGMIDIVELLRYKKGMARVKSA